MLSCGRGISRCDAEYRNVMEFGRVVVAELRNVMEFGRVAVAEYRNVMVVGRVAVVEFRNVTRNTDLRSRNIEMYGVRLEM